MEGPLENLDMVHHYPVCEVCHKESDDIHELSKHVNQEHRNQESGIRVKNNTKWTEVTKKNYCLSIFRKS
jgi:hypothetical protein